MPKKKQPRDDQPDFLHALMASFYKLPMDYEQRMVGRWDSADGRMLVSTAFVRDGFRHYETAVKHPAYNYGKMVIVEAYDTKEAATEGHTRWLGLVETDALPEVLVDCLNCEISVIDGPLRARRDPSYPYSHA